MHTQSIHTSAARLDALRRGAALALERDAALDILAQFDGQPATPALKASRAVAERQLQAAVDQLAELNREHRFVRPTIA